jgi:cysteine-rich repeat protein
MVYGFKKGKFFLIFLVLILFFPVVEADVISVNTGGDTELAITPDKYIEGFFSDLGPFCGNGVIDGGETCDDGNTVSGDGCSSSCQTEAAPPSGGGGGAPRINIAISPSELNVKIAVNSTKEETLAITNFGASTIILALTKFNLEDRINLSTSSITLSPGETEEVTVLFLPSNETGIFVGKIFVGDEEVVVSINVRSEILLFDSNIFVLNENYEVIQGKELMTRVVLIPLGDPERMDVTLNFVIKDYSGNIYLTKSETLLVAEQLGMSRNFDTGSLPLGEYVVGLELIYPNGVAPSSAHFEVVVGKGESVVTKLILYLISLILLVLIIILAIVVWRKLKERKSGNLSVE